MHRIHRAYLRTLQGAGLGVAAPLGWLGFKILTGSSLASELSVEPGLYLYMLAVTGVAFAAFGYIVGRQEEQLFQLSLTDPLTNLKNTRYFQARLQEEYERTKRLQIPFSVIVADLDHFKPVNDRYGGAVP